MINGDSLLFTVAQNIVNRTIAKMSCFKIYASITLIFRKHVPPLNVDMGHIYLYGDCFENNIKDNNQNQLCIACGK